MPFSYQGFGFTAIMLMVAVLSVGQGVRFIRDYLKSRSPKRLG